MTEPVVAGQGQPDTPAEPTNVMVAPAVAPAPAPPTQEAPAGKYAGKPVEDLIREAEDKDRYISELNERSSRLEHEMVLTRNLVEQFARDRGTPKEPPIPDIPVPDDDEFLTNPGKVTASYLDKKLEAHFARMEEGRRREQMEQTVRSAQAAFEQGRTTAAKANPSLFRGIEAGLANQLTQTVTNSIRSGQMVDPDTLRNQGYWTTAAVTYRLAMGEKPVDVLRHFAGTPTPGVAPVYTETPSAGGPQKAAPTLSDEEKMGARFFGVSEEQWVAAKGGK